MNTLFDKYFPRHEQLLELLKPKLEKDEKIIASEYGLCGAMLNMSGILVATDRRVIRFSKRLFREQLISCPYNSITMLDERSTPVKGKVLNIHFQKGFIAFAPSQKQKFKVGTANLITEIYARIGKGDGEGKQATSPQSSPTALIEELGALKTRGLITEEEFATKKKEILSRI